jgi:hypothetical protein
MWFFIQVITDTLSGTLNNGATTLGVASHVSQADTSPVTYTTRTIERTYNGFSQQVWEKLVWAVL